MELYNLPGKKKMKRAAIPPINAMAAPMSGTTRASSRDNANHTIVSPYLRRRSVRILSCSLYLQNVMKMLSMIVLGRKIHSYHRGSLLESDGQSLVFIKANKNKRQQFEHNKPTK